MQSTAISRPTPNYEYCGIPRLNTCTALMGSAWIGMNCAAFLHGASPTILMVHHAAVRQHRELAVATSSHSSLERFSRRPAAQRSWVGVGQRLGLGVAGKRRQEAQLTLAVIDDMTADAVWWDEGCVVQSLEIMCTDSKGNVLDPWQLSELLMDMGAMSVSVDDASKGTDKEIPLFRDHIASQAFDARVPEASSTGSQKLWGDNSRVVALFPAQWDLGGVVNSVEKVFELASPLSFAVDNVEDQDWIKTVQEGWEPIEAGKLRIRFPWHEPLPLSQLGRNKVELVLEGGRAFGTGEHPTTALCLDWLEKASTGNRVLDYGSGSGILGLAALKFGATEAIGIELDLGSIASAAINAANNGLVMDTYYPQEVGSGGGLDLVLTKLWSVKTEPAPGTMEVLPVPDGEAIPASQLGTFDIIVANILARPILRLQPVFARFVKPGGKIALSGVLEEQAQTVVEAFKDTFDLKVAKTLGGWVLIVGTRRTD